MSTGDLDDSSQVVRTLREALQREVKQASVDRRGGSLLLSLKSETEQRSPGQSQRADIEIRVGRIWDPAGIWKARGPNGSAEAPGPIGWPEGAH